MSKTVLIPLAEGFEEIEAVTLIDVLRRAKLDVVVVSIANENVMGAHNLLIKSDALLINISDLPDAIVLPGGMPGAENLKNSDLLIDLIKKANDQGRLIAAICAAPSLVLSLSGVLDNKRATCYPGFQENFPSSVKFSENSVVVDGNIITSRGPGTAMEFALEIVSNLCGDSTSESLKREMIVN